MPPCPGQNQLHLFTFYNSQSVTTCVSLQVEKQSTTARSYTTPGFNKNTKRVWALQFELFHINPFYQKRNTGPKILPVNLSWTYVTPSSTSPKAVGTYLSVSCLNMYPAAVLIHRSLALNWRRTNNSTATENCSEGIRNPYPALNIIRAIIKSRGKTWTEKKCIQNHGPKVRMEETTRNT